MHDDGPVDTPPPVDITRTDHTDLELAGTREVDESEAEIADGEFADDPPPVTPVVSRVPGIIDAPPPLRVRLVRAVKHPVWRAVVLWWVRHTLLIGLGHQSWARRIHAAATYGHVREQIDRARAAGDAEALAEWMDRHDHQKQTRHDRIRKAPQTILSAVRVLLVGVLVLGLLLLVGGVWFKLALGRSGWGMWWGLVGTTGHVISLVFTYAALALIYGGVPLWVLASWVEGKRHGRPLTWAWALTPKQRDAEGSIITPAGIAEALAHMPIAPLKQAIKAGWTVRFMTPPVKVNNRGYEAVFDLPLGVTVDMLADNKPVLARNLNRSTLDVWPVQGDHNGIVVLWVSNQGSTNRPAPPYPLLTHGTVDVFAGVPCGVSQRGDVISPALFEANFVFGGLPGQGKSNAVRVVLLGAALDPIVELWVFVFANNGDFDVYAPRLARYRKGIPSADPEVAESAEQALDELFREVGRREQRLADLGVKKLSRPLAEKNPDLRPIVAAFSECHELFRVSDDAAETAINVVKRGRKVGVILLFDTQSARKSAIPPELVENVAVNSCFHVKSWRNNDGFLGDGSFQAGIRATELRFNVDRGTSITTGASDEIFELLRWYYIEADDTGFDAAEAVIARAMELVHPAVTVGGGGGVLAPARRDLLGDVDRVLGDVRVNAPDVAALLRDLAPDWGPYKILNGVQLAVMLGALGIKVPTTNRKLWVDPVVVRKVLAARQIEADDE